MRQPVCELPRTLQQCLKEMPSILVRIPRESDAANVIRPRLQVCLLRWVFRSCPRHDALRYLDESQQSLATSHTNRLVISHLSSLRKRFRRFLKTAETLLERL